jgi:hypothetical protein
MPPTWWMWAFLVWVLVSIPAGVLVGRAFRAGQREDMPDRDVGAHQPRDERSTDLRPSPPAARFNGSRSRAERGRPILIGAESTHESTDESFGDRLRLICHLGVGRGRGLAVRVGIEDWGSAKR